MNDLKLRQAILDELEFEPSVNAAHIGVAAESGVVTLSGQVASYVEKLAVEKAVKRVKGVRAIAEEIKVRFPSDRKTADSEIAARAVNILKWSAAVPPNSVDVKVQDGWIALSGEVDWHYQRSDAEIEVRRLSGVTGVVNGITIRAHAQAVDIKRRIEDALLRNAQIEAQRIRVSVVDGGRVALEGFVHGWQEREAVEQAAWSAPGVAWVEDRLVLG